VAPARRVTEAPSWRPVTEVVRRHAGELRLIGAHGGGGQHDELRVHPRGAGVGAPFFISLNRLGSARRWARHEVLDEHLARRPPCGAPEAIAIVDEAEHRGRLKANPALPTATAEPIVPWLVSALSQ